MRSALASCHTVLWEGSGWKPVSLGDLIGFDDVKKAWRRAVVIIHPDKVKQKGGTPDQAYIASLVFDVLKVDSPPAPSSFFLRFSPSPPPSLSLSLSVSCALSKYWDWPAVLSGPNWGRPSSGRKPPPASLPRLTRAHFAPFFLNFFRRRGTSLSRRRRRAPAAPFVFFSRLRLTSSLLAALHRPTHLQRLTSPYPLQRLTSPYPPSTPQVTGRTTAGFNLPSDFKM